MVCTRPLASIYSTMTRPQTNELPPDPAEKLIQDAARGRRRALLVALGGMVAIMGLIVYSWLSLRRQEEMARRASWTRLCLCWFGGEPPETEVELAETVRSAQRTEVLGTSPDGAAWPLRCAPYADDLAETLKATSEVGERERMAILFHARRLRDDSQSHDPKVLIAAMAQLANDARHEGIRFERGIAGVEPPPARTPARTLQELIGAESSTPDSLLSLPHPSSALPLHSLDFYLIRDNRPRFIRVEQNGEPKTKDVALLANLAPGPDRAERLQSVLSWGRSPVVVVGDASERVLEYKRDGYAWSVRASDGAAIAPKSDVRLLGSAVTGAQVYSVTATTTAKASSGQGEPVAAVFRLGHHSGEARRDEFSLPGWTMGEGQAAVVGEWVAWVGRDGSISASKVGAESSGATSVVRVVDSESSGLPTFDERLSKATMQLCSTDKASFLHVAVEGEATAVAALENGAWRQLGSAQGTLTCARNAAYLVGNSSVSQCTTDGQCTSRRSPDAHVDHVFAGEYAIDFRRVEELLVLQVTSLASNETKRIVWDGLVDGKEIRLQGRLDSSPRVVGLGDSSILAELYVEGGKYLIRVDLDAMRVERLRVEGPR